MTNFAWWHIVLSGLPIATVLYLMVGRKTPSSQAGVIGWITAVLISLFFFQANITLLWVATGKAILLALFVLYIIWMALLFYHVCQQAGAITAIGQALPKLAQTRADQALLLGWIFASFLQGATGFGVPAAVVSPLLVGLGFAPTVAVVIGLLGHAWAVTFGSLGTSFVTLMATTGLSGEVLASPSAIWIGLAGFWCGFGVLWLAGGQKAVRQRFLFLLMLSLIMGGVQWGLAVSGLWTIAAFGGSFAGLVCTMVYWGQQTAVNMRGLIRAFVPYLILIVVIVLGRIVLPDLLDVWVVSFNFPEVSTGLGWVTPAEAGRSINLFGHAGALLLYTSLLTFAWYKWQGVPDMNGRLLAHQTVQRSVKSTIGILALVAMALTMQHAGMTQLLAKALSNTGPFYPLLSPFIGALGAIMTGSNTNSNVVFGFLQMETAQTLDLSVLLILAAQTTGGALGGVFAPAKVLVGVSTVTGAKEGEVLKSATVYSLLILLFIGLLTWMFA